MDLVLIENRSRVRRALARATRPAWAGLIAERWRQLPARRRRLIVVLVVVAAAGLLAAWPGTRAPAGTGGGDAAAYLGVARNIDAGLGITSPFVNEFDGLSPAVGADVIGHAPLLLWPPGYPMVLASGTIIGLDPETTAALVNLLSISAACVIVALLAYRLSYRSTLAALMAGLAFALSTPVHQAVFSSYSDPLFLALALASVLLLARLMTYQRLFDATAFTLVAAAATLTRYAGAGVIIGGIACVLWAPATPWARKALLATVPLLAAIPAAVWLITVRRSVTNPVSQSHLHYNADAVNGVFTTVPQWYGALHLPAWSQVVAAVATAVLVGPALLRGIGRRHRGFGHHHPVTARAETGRATFFAWHAGASIALAILAVTLGSAMTIGAQLSVNARVLLPVQAVAVAALAAIAARSVRRLRIIGASPAARVVLVAAPVTVLLAGVAWSAALRADQPELLLVADADPTQSAALAELLRDRGVVFANSPSGLYGLTTIGSAPVPTHTSPATGEDNPDFTQQLDELRRVVEERDGAIVFFSSVDLFEPDRASIAETLADTPNRFRTIRIAPHVEVVRPNTDP